MKKIYFYAPDPNIHQFFNKEKIQWMEISKVRKFCSGNFTSWILTTYFHLKQAGLPCEIIDRMPDEGIVIADRDTLGNKYPYLGKLLLICAKGDREFHPSAHCHVVHNPHELEIERNSLWNSYYIPHWLQFGLIPRLKERGNTIENAAFIGSRSNLASEFSSQKWIDALNAIGCKWHPIFSADRWNDYSNIDVIIAARRFTQETWMIKPASKLVNAWIAGVPAILAAESSFSALRKSELDFIAISSLDEALDGLKQLKNNPQLYQAMVENGLERSQEFSEGKITEHWLNFFSEYVFLEYEKLQQMSELNRKASFIKRYLRLKLDRIQERRKAIQPALIG